MWINVWKRIEIYVWTICLIYDIPNKYSLLYDLSKEEGKMNTKKPIIGIVSKHYATYKSNKIDTFIRDEVKQAYH